MFNGCGCHLKNLRTARVKNHKMPKNVINRQSKNYENFLNQSFAAKSV